MKDNKTIFSIVIMVCLTVIALGGLITYSVVHFTDSETKTKLETIEKDKLKDQKRWFDFFRK